MDNTVVVECMEQSEMGSESLGQKRPLENGVETDLSNKKARGGGEDVGFASNVKKVAEIVLVLATMGKMRGGRKPTAVEVQMMLEARKKLADVCKEFAPNDIFPRDAFGTIIEDLGLNRLREQRLGVRPPKMSIAEKLQLTKQKMEKSDAFPLHSNVYTPPSGATDSRGTSNAVRMFSSEKANHAPNSSGTFQHPSTVVHASTANSRTLPYQLPTSEVRPGMSLSVPRAERQHFRLDGGANGSYASQPQAISFAKIGSDKVPAHGILNFSGSSDLNAGRVASQNHVQPRRNLIQAPSTVHTHSEISRIVQRLLHSHLTDHPTWTPPSRDYMNKALTCQMCKGMVNDVDTAIVCDACERGYHLKCLHFNLKAFPRGEWQEWHCAKCLAISQGKPLPPKYGRVMRNISTPKLSSNSIAVSPSSDKKVLSSDVNVQQTTTTNGNSVSQSPGGNGGNDSKSTQLQVIEKLECQNDESPKESSVSGSGKRSDEAKAAVVSESHPNANLEAVTGLPSHQLVYDHPKTRSITNTLAKQSQNDTLAKQSQNDGLLSHVTSSEKKVEGGPNGAINEDEQGDHFKESEPRVLVVEHESSSPDSMHEVEWVGGVVKEIDGKTYYESCCINGTQYKLKDYALFSSTGDKYLPNKLQAMWEDDKTSKKWVTVARCFFPDDLPEGVGRPCAPESNEVYESNHESTLAAGLIHGPCEVLPPSKFFEENAMRTRLRARGNDRPKQLFLCKWFYDKIKRLFRDVTC